MLHQRALNTSVFVLFLLLFLLLWNKPSNENVHSWESSLVDHQTYLSTTTALEERGRDSQTSSWNISHISHSSILPLSQKPFLLVQWLPPSLHNRRRWRCKAWRRRGRCKAWRGRCKAWRWWCPTWFTNRGLWKSTWWRCKARIVEHCVFWNKKKKKKG